MENPLYVISQLQKSSIASERKLAKYIIENPSQVISMSITELAEQVGTSTTAIVRLSKKIDYTGYQELRIAIVKELYSKRYKRPVSDEVALNYNGDSTVTDIVTNVLGVATSTISHIDNLLNRKNIEIVVERIRRSRSILLAGTGASGIVGRDFHQKLTRLGFLSIYNEDSELQTIAACTLTKDDVVIAISYSGDKQTLIRTVEQAKRNNAYVVAITRFKATSLTKIADTVLYVPDTESLYREGASISRLSQLVIVDILFSSLIASDFENSVRLLDKTWRSIDHSISH